MTSLSTSDLDFLQRAANYLEHPSFLVQVADVVGVPLAALSQAAPADLTHRIRSAVRRAVEATLVRSVAEPAASTEVSQAEIRAWWIGYRHTIGMAVTGAFGGALGVVGLLAELPLTTWMLLRSMTAIAGEFGEDLSRPETPLECLSLLSVGGPRSADDFLESSYLTARIGASALVRQAAKYLANTPSEQLAWQLANGSAPPLARLINHVAGRFDVAVSEKLLAQSVPLVGAVSGSLINVAFGEHFNTVARYHFGLRALERHCGASAVQEAYAAACQQLRAARPEFWKPHFGYRQSAVRRADGG